jgi:DNA polymerase-3 subunit epsilon
VQVHPNQTRVQVHRLLNLRTAKPEESDSRAASPPSVVPRTLLILDTETTGLDPETHHCVEVGAILFDVQSRAVLAQQSFLLPAETNAAEPINRIPAAVTRLPQPWKEGLRWFQNLLDAGRCFGGAQCCRSTGNGSGEASCLR